MKKLLKITAIALAAVMVLCLLAVWFISTAPGEDMVRDWLENRLSNEIGLAVSIGNLETNVWSHIQFDSITVSPTVTPPGGARLFVGRLGVRYSISDLLGETTTVRAIAVDNVQLGLELDSLGNLGIPTIDTAVAAPEDTSETSTAFAVDSLQLGRIDLRYSDVRVPLMVEVAGLQVAIHGDGGGSYAGRLTVAATTATYDSLSFSLDSLAAAGTMNAGRLQLDQASARYGNLNLSLVGEIGLDDEMPLALTATATGSLAANISELAEVYDVPVRGELNTQLEFRVGGTIDAPQISLEGLLRDLVVSNYGIDSVWLGAHYTSDTVVMDSLFMWTLGGSISAVGRVALDSTGSTVLTSKLDRLSLSDIWRAVYGEPSPYRGSLAGTVDVQGQGSDWTRWNIGVGLSGENLQYEKRKIPNLTASAHIASSNANFSLVHGDDEITAVMALSPDSLQGTFNFAVPNMTTLARFADQPELSGGFWGDGMVTGAYANPELKTSFFGSGISYRHFPIDSLRGKITVAEGNLTIDDFACQGRIDSISPGESPFDLDSVSGAMSFEVELSGPLDDLQGEVSASLMSPRYYDYSLDSLTAIATLSGSRLSVPELKAYRGNVGAGLRAEYDTASGGGSFELSLNHRATPPITDGESVAAFPAAITDAGSVSGEFRLNPDSSFTANIRGDSLWLGLVNSVTEDSTPIGGYADFMLAMEGALLTPGVTFEARIRPIMEAGYGIDSIVTLLRVDDGALILDSLTSYAHGQLLTASARLGLGIGEGGSYQFDPEAKVEAELETHDFDLSVLSGIALPAGELSGSASMAFSVSGSPSSPELLGWLNLQNGRVVLDVGSPPLDSLALSLSFADTVLNIDSAAAVVTDIPVRANGYLATSNFESATVDLGLSVGAFGRLKIVGIVADTSLSLTVVSDSLDLGVFQPFAPETDSLRGTLDARANIGGKPEAPEIEGTVHIASLAFKVPRQNVNLRDGHADISFDLNRVTLDSCSAVVNGGNLLVSGSVTHDRFELIDIGLIARADRLRLDDPEMYTVVIDTAVLTYGKQADNYVLDGDIILGETRLTAGLRPTSVLPWVREIETVDMELPELVARSRLDVRVRGGDNIWVDNNLARIRLRAEIGVIGTPLRPNFTGLIRVEEGYLLYLDRRFRVNEGSVYFTDPTRFNPEINLDASTQVTVYRRTNAEPYTIFIQAEGMLDQLRYGLYSEPVLDQPDIVALLTLGATRSELTKSGDEGGQSGMTQVLKDRAAMLTSQRVSGYLSRKAGAVFGFDEFTIQGNLFQFDESWGPQLVASKRLSRRIDLTYATTVGHLNDQAVRLGYRLTPRWSLMGETDSQGRSGLNLKYGFTFK